MADGDIAGHAASFFFLAEKISRQMDEKSKEDILDRRYLGFCLVVRLGPGAPMRQCVATSGVNQAF